MIKITREQFYDFIKQQKDTPNAPTKSTQHYLDYFDRYQSTGKKANWNWGGLIPIWFFYRRMYIIALTISFGGRFFVGLVDKALKISGITGDLGEIVSAVASILFLVICMCYADYMYLYYASAKISKGKKTSGVNKGLAITISVLYIVGLIIFLGLKNFSLP